MHPKNSTTPPVAQLPKLRAYEFGPDYTDLFRINPDANLIGALGAAAAYKLQNIPHQGAAK